MTTTPRSGPVRILIADDHELVRQGLSMLVSAQAPFEVVAEVGDGESALAAVGRLLPDLAIIDLDLPRGNGIEVTQGIKASWPQIGIVIITGSLDSKAVNAALACGANAYVSKESDSGELLTALRCVLEGRSYINRKIAQSFSVPDLAGEESSMVITVREKEILRDLARGYSNIEIAESLNITFNTVRTHRKNVMRKLNLHNLAEVTAYAIKRGLL